MALLAPDAYEIKLPRMYRVHQQFNAEEVENIEEMIHRELSKEEIRRKVKPGMKAAVLVGSRGICNLERIVRSVGRELKSMGAEPFIVPAMGSHGGGTAEGQAEMLAGYGITEERVGLPVYSSMEVDEIGITSDGVHVCVDRIAHQADLIVPINRIKPHTDFRGPVESGLCKMLTIGLGKHQGCSHLHQRGFVNFPHLIPEAAKLVIRETRVGFGLAILENGYDRTYSLEAIPAEKILTREPELLKIARNLMPSILFPAVDVLIIEQLGKDISGAGMDPNITGRTTKGRLQGFKGPEIQRIVVESLTEPSHGNACGIGLADYILESCEKQIDRHATSVNAIGSGNPEAGRIPISAADEREAVLCSLRTAVDIDYNALRIVKIKSTLALSDILISEAMLEAARQNDRITICGEQTGLS